MSKEKQARTAWNKAQQLEREGLIAEAATAYNQAGVDFNDAGMYVSAERAHEKANALADRVRRQIAEGKG